MALLTLLLISYKCPGDRIRPREKCHFYCANILARWQFWNLLAKLRFNTIYSKQYKLFSMDPRTCTLARLTASQNNISWLTNFARVPMPEASQNPLWLQIPNSKLHSLFENATPSAIWGGLAGQKHSDAVWF